MLPIVALRDLPLHVRRAEGFGLCGNTFFLWVCILAHAGERRDCVGSCNSLGTSPVAPFVLCCYALTSVLYALPSSTAHGQYLAAGQLNIHGKEPVQ